MERALTPPQPDPQPEVKVVHVVDRQAQAALEHIQYNRWRADWQARYDAHRADLYNRGYCFQHNRFNCNCAWR